MDGEQTRSVSRPASVDTPLRSHTTEPGDGDYGEPPQLTRRYRLTSPLGRGGAGVVFRGWDTELDRPVAIKFVRPDRAGLDPRSSNELGARLRRESRALAALSHPNVVTVYDVIVTGEGVGVVMELVEGVNLRTWLRDTPRPRADVVRVFIDAGRGLAAAHAAGLVHRDFKPANVIVGSDARVKVLDFGLARASTSPSDPATGVSSRSISRATGSESTLTQSGVVMGTPAYMAPEQIDGSPVDDRGDQFSFCAAVFEGLWGERPFASRSMKHRRRLIAQGPVFPHHGVSGRLQRAIRRGLQEDPDDRHRSMVEVVAALEAELRPSSRRRWWVPGIALGSLAGAASWSSRSPQPMTCDASESPLSIWSDQRRAAMQSAFLATRVPFAEQAWSRSADALDAYVERWNREHLERCERVDTGGASAEETQCLSRVRHRFEALVIVFESADPDVVEHALTAASRLPDPAACQAAATSGRPDWPELGRAHARVLALRNSGRYADALDASRTLLSAARQRGATAYVAEALLQIGGTQDELGAYEDALRSLTDAYFAAIREGEHEAAARAAISAAVAVGKGLRRRDDGLLWIRHARTQAQRLDQPDEIPALLAGAEGAILMSAGEREAALSRLEAARVIFERVRGEDAPDTVNVINNIGVVYQELGRFQEALEHHHAARALWMESLGPGHPRVTSADHAIANTLALMGRSGEAIEAYRGIIAAWEQTLSPSHPLVAMTYYNVGRLHQLEEEPDRALEAYLHAIGLLEQSMGRDHVNTAMPVHNVGALYHEKGDLEQAQAYLERSLAVFEQGDVDPLYVAINRFELAKVLHERGLESRRVAALIVSAREQLVTGGAFGENELQVLRVWTTDNRPDLQAPSSRP